MAEKPDLSLLQDAAKLGPYLVERGFLRDNEPLISSSLGGGVSNHIVKITTRDRSLVMKQAQPKLNVQIDWFAPIDRVLIEAACMEGLRDLVPAGTIPKILFIDEERYLYAMECAPDNSVLWKIRLLQGDIQNDTAQKVGEILGAMHSRTHESTQLREQFWQNRILHALRIDPCFTFLAGVHPELAPQIKEQARNLDQTKYCLVHGDYTPKNMLLSDDRLILLDYEIAHWGNPALDSGFLIAHLLLKAIHNPSWTQGYLEAARVFWNSYINTFSNAEAGKLELEAVKLIPFLVLARIDSKSPVEYIIEDDRKEYAREFATKFILSPVFELEELLAYFQSDRNNTG
jgi:tRNA A-37 threonylcarbamoyl transferase component Bud32